MSTLQQWSGSRFCAQLDIPPKGYRWKSPVPLSLELEFPSWSSIQCLPSFWIQVPCDHPGSHSKPHCPILLCGPYPEPQIFQREGVPLPTTTTLGPSPYLIPLAWGLSCCFKYPAYAVPPQTLSQDTPTRWLSTFVML